MYGLFMRECLGDDDDPFAAWRAHDDVGLDPSGGASAGGGGGGRAVELTSQPASGPFLPATYAPGIGIV